MKWFSWLGLFWEKNMNGNYKIFTTHYCEPNHLCLIETKQNVHFDSVNWAIICNNVSAIFIDYLVHLFEGCSKLGKMSFKRHWWHITLSYYTIHHTMLVTFILYHYFLLYVMQSLHCKLTINESYILVI